MFVVTTVESGVELLPVTTTIMELGVELPLTVTTITASGVELLPTLVIMMESEVEPVQVIEDLILASIAVLTHTTTESVEELNPSSTIAIPLTEATSNQNIEATTINVARSAKTTDSILDTARIAIPTMESSSVIESTVIVRYKTSVPMKLIDYSRHASRG